MRLSQTQHGVVLMKKIHNINFSIIDENIQFGYGDRVYIVEPDPRDKPVILYAKCPACNDKRYITYKGYDEVERETNCPLCFSGTGSNHIVMRNWTINEYITYEFVLAGPDSKNAYKNISPMRIKDIKAFYRYGRNNSDISYAHLRSAITDQNPAKIKSYDSGQTYCYHKKEDAKALMKAFVEHDKQLLKEFNEKYGTNHEYPF